MSNRIDESTAVSITMVLAILGGVGFVTYVAFQSDATARAVEVLQKKQDNIDLIVTDIAVIKTKLDSIEKHMERK